MSRSSVPWSRSTDGLAMGFPSDVDASFDADTSDVKGSSSRTPCVTMGRASSCRSTPTRSRSDGPMSELDVSLMRGTLDLLILKALSWGPRHGYGVAEWIEQATDA